MSSLDLQNGSDKNNCSTRLFSESSESRFSVPQCDSIQELVSIDCENLLPYNKPVNKLFYVEKEESLKNLQTQNLPSNEAPSHNDPPPLKTCLSSSYALHCTWKDESQEPEKKSSLCSEQFQDMEDPLKDISFNFIPSQKMLLNSYFSPLCYNAEDQNREKNLLQFQQGVALRQKERHTSSWDSDDDDKKKKKKKKNNENCTLSIPFHTATEYTSIHEKDFKIPSESIELPQPFIPAVHDSFNKNPIKKTDSYDVLFTDPLTLQCLSTTPSYTLYDPFYSRTAYFKIRYKTTESSYLHFSRAEDCSSSFIPPNASYCSYQAKDLNLAQSTLGENILTELLRDDAQSSGSSHYPLHKIMNFSTRASLENSFKQLDQIYPQVSPSRTTDASQHSLFFKDLGYSSALFSSKDPDSRTSELLESQGQSTLSTCYSSDINPCSHLPSLDSIPTPNFKSQNSETSSRELPSNQQQRPLRYIQELLHTQCLCKPCAFFYNKKKGCSNGGLCEFCHHEDHSKYALKQWKKHQQRFIRQFRRVSMPLTPSNTNHLATFS